MILYKSVTIKNMTQVSIIVPVYNVKKYLRRCVDSILTQTFTDFELLLVDDGSTDSSGKICDEYKDKDDRIRVFHKENGGVSSARNLGLDNARGRWITFVDSDDWIKNDYLSSMVIRSTDADLIMSSFETTNEIKVCDNKIKDEFFENTSIKNFVERYIYTATLCSPWCKLFKKSLIDGLRFNEKISFAEDTIFVFEYLVKINSVRTVDIYSYQYNRDINDSLSRRLLSVQEYRYIIFEYSKSLGRLETKINYDATFARVISNSNQLRKCINIIRNSNESLRYRYNEFVELLNDDYIQECLKYKNNKIKGRSARLFDFLALNKLYFLLFICVISYKKSIY